MLRSAEALFLLLLDENTGALVAIPRKNLDYALAGSVLMDLQLAGRIDSDLAGVRVIDSTPLGDELLDPVLATDFPFSGAIVKDIVSESWCAVALWPTRVFRRGPAVAPRAADRQPGGTVYGSAPGLADRISYSRRRLVPG